MFEPFRKGRRFACRGVTLAGLLALALAPGLRALDPSPLEGLRLALIGRNAAGALKS